MYSLGTLTKEPFRDTLDDYFESEEVLAFSQTLELTLSLEPKVSVLSLGLNKYSRNKQLENLLEMMFSKKDNPIYHSFLREHKNSFTTLLNTVITNGTKDGNESFLRPWRAIQMF